MTDRTSEIAGIHQHLHRHDLRFDKLESRFDNLEGRFDKLEGRFDKLETEVSQMGTKLGLQLEQLQSTQQFLAEQTSSFIHSNTDLRQRVESLEEKQSMTDLRLRMLERP